MNDMLIAAFASGYGVAYLHAARYLFSRWRIMSLQHKRYEDKCHKHTFNGERNRYSSGCCYALEENRRGWPDGNIAFFAMACAIPWPVILLVAAVRMKPKLAPSEIQAEQERQKAYVAELEEEIRALGSTED